MTTLYIRNVPDELARQAKVEAARRGIPLGRLVLDALSREVGAAEQHPASLRVEAAWFAEHREKLVARHEGEYVAVVGKRVVDHDPDFARLAPRVFERFADRPAYIVHCQLDERVVRLRSPRVKR